MSEAAPHISWNWSVQNITFPAVLSGTAISGEQQLQERKTQEDTFPCNFVYSPANLNAGSFSNS